jgi:hypothetical protein
MMDFPLSPNRVTVQRAMKKHQRKGGKAQRRKENDSKNQGKDLLKCLSIKGLNVFRVDFSHRISVARCLKACPLKKRQKCRDASEKPATIGTSLRE